MDTSSVAHPAPQSTRELRGRALAGEHFEEIAQSHRRGVYAVPSCTGEHTYTVAYTRRDESCECPDWQYRGVTCQHLYAAAIVAAKTRTCDGCGVRVHRSELVEVMPEHVAVGVEVLEGQRYCRPCAGERAVL